MSVKRIALTFDDGPNTVTTPLVLNKLEMYGVVATFFLVGQNITEETKSIVDREVALGCEIGNHSLTHANLAKSSTEEILAEINGAGDIISRITGKPPKIFRPPYLALSDSMYTEHMPPLIGGIHCRDWEPDVTTRERIDTILNHVKDGDILLLHDFEGNVNTVEALDEIIPGLQKEGYEFVTVSRLFEESGVNPKLHKKIWNNAYD